MQTDILLSEPPEACTNLLKWGYFEGEYHRILQTKLAISLEILCPQKLEDIFASGHQMDQKSRLGLLLVHKVWCLLASMLRPIPSSFFFRVTSSRTSETKASDGETVPAIWCCSRDVSHCLAKSLQRPLRKAGDCCVISRFCYFFVHLS